MTAWGALAYASSAGIVCLYAFYTGDRMVGNRPILPKIDSSAIPLESILSYGVTSKCLPSSTITHPSIVEFLLTI